MVRMIPSALASMAVLKRKSVQYISKVFNLKQNGLIALHGLYNNDQNKRKQTMDTSRRRGYTKPGSVKQRFQRMKAVPLPQSQLHSAPTLLTALRHLAVDVAAVHPSETLFFFFLLLLLLLLQLFLLLIDFTKLAFDHFEHNRKEGQGLRFPSLAA